MATKIDPTGKAATERARHEVEEVKAELERVEASLRDLSDERDQIVDEVEEGKLTADTERLDELTETLIPRKGNRSEYLRTQALPLAESRLSSHELRDLATDGSVGVEVKHADYIKKRDAATTKLAKAIAELREASDEWNGTIKPLQLRALRAGLTTSTGDPFGYVLVDVDFWGKPTGQVYVGSETYAAVSADRVIGNAVSSADRLLARHVAEGRESDYLAQPWR